MRRLHGPHQARQFFASRHWSLQAPLPDALRQRTREIFGEELNAPQVARRIIEQVRSEGDAALERLSSQIDGEPLGFIEVPRDQMRRSVEEIPRAVREALESAAARVRDFHITAMPRSWHDAERGYGEVVIPVERVGAYVPAGSAPLISAVIMTVGPARAAGVREVCLTTPAPGDSLPHPAMLAAAEIAGVDRVFKLGGAQAIAALALGTETVPRVDLVAGPGSIFVIAAKKLLYGEVGVDGIYGPTETLVIADDSADPDLCAADLLAQAEHDVMARPVLVTTSEILADAVDAGIEARLRDMGRRSIAEAALQHNGAAIVVSDVETAIQVSNMMAPEHVCLAVKEPQQYVPLVRAAGGLFLGEHSAEVLGDYIAGPSHVMPTGGTARFASALSARHFVRITPVVHMSDDQFVEVGGYAAELARVEGLGAHAAAAEARLHRLIGE